MLVRLVSLVFFFLTVGLASATTITPKNPVALSSSQPKQKVGFNFSTIVSSNSKKASVKVISANKPLVKAKPALMKLKPNRDSGELAPIDINFSVNKSQLSALTGSEQVLITLVPNAAALVLGIEESSFLLDVITGETTSIAVDTVFGGQPVLPSTDTSLNARMLPVTREPSKSIEPGLATLLNYPANAGSCALGLGGEPLSTSVGPGGSDTASGGALRYGDGTAEDPLYIVFNNPNNGGETEELTASSLPLDLFASGSSPAFAQIYEGVGATGTVLCTVTGTAEFDAENQAISLTTPDGVIISYSKDGSKDIALPQELTDFVGGLGVSLNQAMDFLEGGSLPITIPGAEIQAKIQEGVEEEQELDSDITASMFSDLTGSLTLTGNRMNGTFTGTGTVSFDIEELGTQTLSGANNIQMNISSDNPALVSGFGLRNASGSMTISGGDGFIQSISADFIINSANVSVASGITASDVTITNTSFVQDDSFLPDDGGSGGDGDGSAFEQCMQGCFAQGGDESTCEAACADL